MALSLMLSFTTMTVATPPVSAAVAPLADVGLREFLVKDGGALLRLSLPSSMTAASPMDLPNDPGRQAQEAVELVKLRLEQVGFSGKPAVWSACLKEVNTANSIVQGEDFLKSVPQSRLKKAKEIVEETDRSLEELRDAIRKEDIKGTLAAQERAADQVYQVRKLAMKSDLPYEIPAEFASFPRLTGRATVRMEIARGGGSSKPFVLDDGTKSSTLPFDLVVDGYRAPITGGNFVDLVKRKMYDGTTVSSQNELFVNVGPEKGVRKIPLELFYKKDTTPAYHYSSDDDLRATEAFADPFQAVGALGMIRDPEEPDTASSQFFFLKWDQGLVAPGRNTLDGSSACFGYVVKNQGAIEQITASDTILKATIVEGVEFLKS